MEWNNKWNLANKERRLFIKLKSQNKRTGRMNGGTLTYSDWLVIKEEYKNSCAFCGKPESEAKLTQDHIIPISRGGLHNKKNIQPLCQSCNSRKSNKLDYRLIAKQ